MIINLPYVLFIKHQYTGYTKIKLNRSLLFAYIIGTSEIEKVNIYIINCFLKRDGGEKSITVDKLINS